MAKAPSIQKKTLNSPDETRTFDKGKLELAMVGSVTFGRGVFQPGWKWSECVKPLVKTEYCEAPRVQYHVSGRLGVRMADGTEMEFGPGDVGVLPPGHDAWVVAEEEVVVIDVSGMKQYARPSAKRSAKKKSPAKTAKVKTKKRRR